MSKSFPGVKALDDVQLRQYSAASTSGAKKFIPMKIIIGIYLQDRGELHMHGRQLILDSPPATLRTGSR